LWDTVVISPDGRQVAYSVPEGDAYSIRVGEAGSGARETRVLCRACGKPHRFSPDGRFLLYNPEISVKPDPKRKFTVRLLEVANGKDRPWLEDASDSVLVCTLGQDSAWLVVVLAPPGSSGFGRGYLVPWREQPVPKSEWIKIPLPDAAPNDWRVSPAGNFFYFLEGSHLMAIRFNPQRVDFSERQEVKFVPGSTVTLKSDDAWEIRGPGLVLEREELANSSVWLMKLPR
jgi:hypothetical protein